MIKTKRLHRAERIKLLLIDNYVATILIILLVKVSSFSFYYDYKLFFCMSHSFD